MRQVFTSLLNTLSKQLVFLSKRTDLVVAIIVLIAIVIMIIPLPTILVDILIGTNIAASVLILLIGLSLVNPTEFSTLPSVILIATLFRLAITISTSRLILLDANAGDIVQSFGDYVVGGNVAVGLIIFLIITTAQFLVITKGSERVAEVAARFTLDALPGKQMSIDSDLRNGDIDQNEARRQRKMLERESQLYGAMDGAMKFVKGDAMAGLVIILVNLAGGLAIGTIQRGLATSEAVHTYLLLTVGDGLVAQLPALLVSVAAGTVITRVASEDQRDLGAEVARQLFGHERALVLASVVLACLALVPGLPSYVFLVLAAIFAAIAIFSAKQNKQAPKHAYVNAGQTRQNASAPTKAADKSSKDKALAKDKAYEENHPVVLRLGTSFGSNVLPEEMQEVISMAQSNLFETLGVQAPTIDYWIDGKLKPQGFIIELNEVPVAQGEIDPSHLIVTKTADDISFLKIPWEKSQPGSVFNDALLVDQQYEEILFQNGIDYYKPTTLLYNHLSQMLERYAPQFVEIQETRNRLTEIDAKYPDLFKTLQGNIELPKITEILRRLVEEKISIRNLRVILEVVAEWAYREKDVVLLVEYVRAALSRQICFRYADQNHVIAAYMLDRKLEEVVRNAIQPTAVGAYLTVSEEVTRPIIQQIQAKMKAASSTIPPIVLTSMDIRRHVRNLFVRNGIDLAVLSYQEVAPEFNIQTLATIQASSLKDTVGEAKLLKAAS